MITIHELCEQAYHIDQIDVLRMTRQMIPEIVSFSSEELFPDYPSTPYTDINPDATDQEIFKIRLLPMFLIRLQLIVPDYPHPHLMLRMQSPKHLSGIA